MAKARRRRDARGRFVRSGSAPSPSTQRFNEAFDVLVFYNGAKGGGKGVKRYKVTRSSALPKGMGMLAAKRATEIGRKGTREARKMPGKARRTASKAQGRVDRYINPRPGPAGSRRNRKRDTRGRFAKD